MSSSLPALPPEWSSKKAYARFRELRGLPGGSPAAVRKALDRYGLTEGLDGQIPALELHLLWELARTGTAPPIPSGEPGELVGEPDGGNPGEPLSPREVIVTGEPQAHGGELKRSRAVLSPAEKRAKESLTDAKARKESALANLREKEDREKEGELVQRQAVASAWFEVGRKTRDRGAAEVGPLAHRLAAAAVQEIVAALGLDGDEARRVADADLVVVLRPEIERSVRAIFADLAGAAPGVPVRPGEEAT